jgi:hypothetical protein
MRLPTWAVGARSCPRGWRWEERATCVWTCQPRRMRRRLTTERNIQRARLTGSTRLLPKARRSVPELEIGWSRERRSTAFYRTRNACGLVTRAGCVGARQAERKIRRARLTGPTRLVVNDDALLRGDCRSTCRSERRTISCDHTAIARSRRAWIRPLDYWQRPWSRARAHCGQEFEE